VWRALVTLFGAALVLAPSTARGAAPLVHLEVEGCPTLDARSVQRIFSADLGTSTAAEGGPDITEVTISCESERVTVRVRDPISRKTLKRSFDPKSFGTQAESRVVAIAASELVLASWAELASNPAPQVPAEGPAPSADAVETARSVVRARSAAPSAPTTAAETPAEKPPAPVAEPSDNEQPEAVAQTSAGNERAGKRRNEPLTLIADRVTGVVSFRSFLTGAGTLWGGGVRFGRERSGVVSWAADALLETGVLHEYKNATNATLGGWLCFYANLSVFTFRGGGGLRAGVLTADTGPRPAIWGWPMLVASQTLRIDSLVLDLSAESGYVNLLVTGKSDLRGLWVSGQLGVGIAL
jgi:hypothetical protein